VTGITLSPTNIRLEAIGATFTPTVRATDQNGNVLPSPVLAWSSSNTAVATVDASGVIRAVARGIAVITAAAGPGIQASITVTVDPVATRVTVTPAPASLQSIGATAQFTAHVFDSNNNEFTATAVWTSSSPTVATINSAGLATSRGNGTTNITATVGALSGSATLTVGQVVTRLVSAERNAVLGSIGASAIFHVTAFDASGNVVATPVLAWSSADASIATVDGTGNVTARGYGRTQITVAAGTVSDVVTVDVIAPTIVITPASIDFTATGQTRTVAARLRDVGGSEEPITPQWSSTNTAVATVNAAGLVTATGVGVAGIRATFEGTTVGIPVTVTQASHPGFLTGRVVIATTNTPVAGALVTFTRPGSGSVSVTTDATGQFTSPSLDSSVLYDIVISAGGYISTNLFATAVTPDFTAAMGNLPLVPNSADPGSISGVVQNARNASLIAGAAVSLRSGINATTGPVVATTTTNSSGQFSFTGMPAGVYSLAASADGYAGGIRPGIVLGGNNVTGQDITLSPLGSEGELRFVLTWGAAPNDLDSHLTGPVNSEGGRFHVAYYSQGSNVSSPFASLDRDDTSAFGPETVTITSQLPGVYRYYIHNYSGYPDISQSNGHVDVYRGSVRIAEFYVPVTGSGRYWLVFEMNGNTLTPINTIVSSEPYLRADGGDASMSSGNFDLARIARDIAAHPKAGSTGGEIRRIDQ
ncbi:MAG: Ig-like domain-containing protein, partial [Longimicrobiales bacterium]